MSRIRIISDIDFYIYAIDEADGRSTAFVVPYKNGANTRNVDQAIAGGIPSKISDDMRKPLGAVQPEYPCSRIWRSLYLFHDENRFIRVIDD